MNPIIQTTYSIATLIKASLIAFCIAAILLVLVVLPAEYDVDLTGFGKFSGLTVLSKSAESSAENSATKQSEPNADSTKIQTDTAEILVLASSGIEYKFEMEQFQKLNFEWKTDGGNLYFDFHGEPRGDTTRYFESYSISTSNQVTGSTTTPFAGSHGWYWRNDSEQDIVVTLTTKGQYKVIGDPRYK